MAERGDLEAAAAAGIIAPESVDPLHAFLLARKPAVAAPAPPSGEEDLRFIRNFHDVFLAIGIVLLATGMAVAIATFVSRFGSDGSAVALASGVGCVGAAVTLWALAEFFAGRRRLFLPAIALCVAFTGYCTVATFMLFGLAIAQQAATFHFGEMDFNTWPALARIWLIVVAAAALAAAAGFYMRFRLPFSIGFAGICAVGFLGALVFAIAPQWVWNSRSFLMFAFGALLFAVGVWFDSRDPARTSRLSDNGFWLHMAAAPLVLNGALALARPADGGGVGLRGLFVGVEDSVPSALLALAIIAVLGMLSLLVNRRALIVSALLTTGVAIGVLMNATGLGAGALIAGTLVSLGGFVLVLGASWHGMRRLLLKWVKPDGVFARIFPPEQMA